MGMGAHFVNHFGVGIENVAYDMARSHHFFNG